MTIPAKVDSPSTTRPFARRVLSRLIKRKALLRWPEPVVSFTFDDFCDTAAVAGAQILEKYHARGTFYACMGLMGASLSQNRRIFSKPHLDAIIRGGHELGSHTYSHPSCHKSSLVSFAWDALKGELAVRRVSAKGGRSNFAFPYGHLNRKAMMLLRCFTRSCRAASGGPMFGEIDLDQLQATTISTVIYNKQSIDELIAENTERRGWLIFLTHDICDLPSVYGCTPSQFESVVSAAVQSGSRILTISEALDVIQECNEDITNPSKGALGAAQTIPPIGEISSQPATGEVRG